MKIEQNRQSQETEAKSGSAALKGRAHTVQNHIHYSLAKLPCVVIKTQSWSKTEIALVDDSTLSFLQLDS